MSIKFNLLAPLLFSLSLFIGLGSSFADETPKWTDVLVAGGPGDDAAHAAKMDGQGNLYVLGHFSATAKFENKNLYSSGKTDMFLAKYSHGAWVWAVQAGGNDEDVGEDLALDDSGNIYITGWVTGPSTFLSNEGAPQTIGFSGDTIFISKYNPDGKLQWLQTGHQPEGQGNNNGYGIAVNSEAGSCYITGRGQGRLTFSSSSGESVDVSGPGTWHMFLVKYDLNGNFQWGRSSQASPNCVAHKVAVDSEDNAYAVGWMEGQTTFFSGDSHHQTITGLSAPVQTPPYPDDAFLAKYDSNGNVKWVNQVGGYKAIAVDVATSKNGQIAVTGFIGNVEDGIPAHATTVATSQPPKILSHFFKKGVSKSLGKGMASNPFNEDVLLITYDREGSVLWTKRFGGFENEVGTGVAFDSDNNLYLSGAYEHSFPLGEQTLTGAGDENLFVMKFSNSKIVWTNTAGRAGSPATPEAGYPRIFVNTENVLVVTGQLKGSTEFDGTNVVGADDIFSARMTLNPPKLLTTP